MGFDIETWLRAGLADILITTCYPMIGGVDEQEIDEFFRDLADRRGVDAAELRDKLEANTAFWRKGLDEIGLEALVSEHQRERDTTVPARAGMEPAGRERTRPRPLHANIEIAFVQLVECPRGRRCDQGREPEHEHLPGGELVTRYDNDAGHGTDRDQETQPHLGGVVDQFECRNVHEATKPAA